MILPFHRVLGPFALALTTACSAPISLPATPHPAPGEVRSIEPVGGYPALALRLVVWWEGLSEEIPVEHGISLYRVEYGTTSPDGTPTFASGLVAFPRGDAPLRGVVSFQHGTASHRALSPSAPHMGNGVLAAAVFAGHGYLLVAPDYLGLGSSGARHPYLHAGSAATAVVDLLRAARRVAAAAGAPWPEALFLAGFSQGGHATLAAQRALEAAPEPGLRVTASAAVAGPYDLARISFPHALAGAAPSDSLYLAYMVDSYARIYAQPLASVLTDAHARAVPALFDGRHDGEAIRAALPERPREMFRPEFLADYDAGRPTWLLQRLAENSLDDWTPRAPVRLYYGDLDLDVTPEEAKAEARRLAARGGDVRALSVGAADHDGSVLPAVTDLRGWFDELGARPGPRSPASEP
jgi:hypothetical protein